MHSVQRCALMLAFIIWEGIDQDYAVTHAFALIRANSLLTVDVRWGSEFLFAEIVSMRFV